MSVRFFTMLIFVLIGVSGFSQQKFEGVLKELFQQPDYKNASVGIHIQDLETGETLFGVNAEKSLIPASTMKLITSATALELLGADYRFETKLGYIGETEKNNTLNGDLVVIGGGDPTLGSEHFKEHYFNFFENWARKIKNAGIERIDGDLILDGSIYDSEKVPATWIWEDIGNYYGAGANAFTIYDNLFRITFNSPRKVGKATAIISMNPNVEGLEIDNQVKSANNNSDNAYVFGSPLDKARIIRGTIPRNRKAFTIKAAIHQPEEILAQELLKYLAKEGVFISGKIRFEKVSQKDFKTVFIQESPTLAEIVKVLNYESVNLFAEHLVKHIAAEKSGVGNREVGIEIIKEFWQSKGISTEYLFMEDGSGLSHFNAVSPTLFTAVLSYMAKVSSNKKAFLNSLPGAGKGTLSRFNPQLFPANSLKAKSGSMTRVRCYGGYLILDSGKTVVFSIMVNHFSGGHSKLIGEVEKLLEEMKNF
ncbi:MAG: D-alanyl-D-alanine carboxypeptidase/D-alanyl-D-alanine-endopeptidase [Bacteroidetes bacterium]|nr:D-alanyl-D-alanine carboxypeptidase/D-alanyl-D-alanine-endopeptidase [Bacteroidota bacterium]